MPYVIREGTVQATDIVDAGVQDVYYSPNVNVNNVPVALWQPPVTGNSSLSLLNMPPATPVPNYAPNPEQIANYKAGAQAAAADPEPFYIAQGQNAGTIGNQSEAVAPGSNTSDPNDLSGNPDAQAGMPLASGETILGRLENYLNQQLQASLSGAWKAQGSAPGNPNIMNCYLQVGFPPSSTAPLGPGDSVAWCAAFAGTAIKAAGGLWLKSLSSKAYSDVWFAKGAQRVPINDPSQWRRNDVVYKEAIIRGKVQGHVCFLRGIDLQTGKVSLLGGNQSNNVCVGHYTDYHQIISVGRAWPVDAAFDKPVTGPISG